MFRRPLASSDGPGKAGKVKRSYREQAKRKLHKMGSPPLGSSLTSPIITITLWPGHSVTDSSPRSDGSSGSLQHTRKS